MTRTLLRVSEADMEISETQPHKININKSVIAQKDVSCHSHEGEKETKGPLLDRSRFSNKRDQWHHY